MLIFIAGEGGSGKDYLSGKLLKYFEGKIEKLVTYTTRGRRDNEVDGVDYNFIYGEKFVRYSYDGMFLESRNYNFIDKDTGKKITVRYATPTYKDFNKVYISWGSVDQAIKIKEANKDETVVIHLISSARDRITRMIERATTDAMVVEACRRVYQDYLDYEDVKERFNPDFVVHNDGISDKAFKDLKALIKEEVLK